MGAIIGIRATNKSRRAISRQEWINGLRDSVSQCEALLLACVRLQTKRPLTDEDKMRTMELNKEAQVYLFKIELFLNPDKPDQKAIIDCLCRLHDLMLKVIGHGTSTTEGVSAAAQIDKEALELTRATQKIIRTTWIKVKDGK